MCKKVIDNITVLAGNDEQAEFMRELAGLLDLNVKNVTVWDGPCPDGSFVKVAPSVRMSTAEFYTLRKVSELPLFEGILFIDEMCGLYETNLTNPRLADGELHVLNEPRTTSFDLFLYLMQISDTDQGMKALTALSCSTDRLGGPIAAKRDALKMLRSLR